MVTRDGHGPLVAGTGTIPAEGRNQHQGRKKQPSVALSIGGVPGQRLALTSHTVASRGPLRLRSHSRRSRPGQFPL